MSLDKKIFRELKGHPYVLGLIKKETDRVKHNVELIASENYCSDAVRAACASILSCKYAEGYPDLRRWSGNTGRYYGGCEYIDELEEHCCEMWREVFDTNYHVNVHSFNDLVVINQDLTSRNGRDCDIIQVYRPFKKHHCSFDERCYENGELMFLRRGDDLAPEEELEEMTLSEIFDKLGKKVKIIPEEKE